MKNENKKIVTGLRFSSKENCHQQSCRVCNNNSIIGTVRRKKNEKKFKTKHIYSHTHCCSQSDTLNKQNIGITTFELFEQKENRWYLFSFELIIGQTITSASLCRQI